MRRNAGSTGHVPRCGCIPTTSRSNQARRTRRTFRQRSTFRPAKRRQGTERIPRFQLIITVRAGAGQKSSVASLAQLAQEVEQRQLRRKHATAVVTGRDEHPTASRGFQIVEFCDGPKQTQGVNKRKHSKHSTAQHSTQALSATPNKHKHAPATAAGPHQPRRAHKHTAQQANTHRTGRGNQQDSDDGTQLLCRPARSHGRPPKHSPSLCLITAMVPVRALGQANGTQRRLLLGLVAVALADVENTLTERDDDALLRLCTTAAGSNTRVSTRTSSLASIHTGKRGSSWSAKPTIRKRRQWHGATDKLGRCRRSDAHRRDVDSASPQSTEKRRKTPQPTPCAPSGRTRPCRSGTAPAHRSP